MIRRVVAAGLIAGHSFVHVALPFFDVIIHALAALIFLWSFYNARA